MLSVFPKLQMYLDHRINEMISLGDTVSTYFNRHLGGGGCVLVSSDLNSEKKVRVFILGGGCSG